MPADGFATYPSLRGRVVVITGGGSGIGAKVVEAFVLQGSKVAFLDIARGPSEELVRKLSSRGAHAPVFFPCDLTNIAELRRVLAEIEARLGAIRVLVNNAGNDDRHKFSEVTPEYWDERMAINLRHQFFATQAAAPGMAAAGGGSVINMGSISWMVPLPGIVAYTTAKAAISGMTRTVARELGTANIRVNCVAPGSVTTERQQKLWLTREYLAEIMARQSLKRELVPEDVARLILFLAADDSSAITGQTYVIDGGWV